MKHVYIIDSVRTPRAKHNGAFSQIHPIDLATLPLTKIIERNRLDPTLIDDLILGCVSQREEQANIIARKAILAAGLPESVPGVTLNRFCGSGLSAINWAAQSIQSGMHRIVIAGGIEHMTRVPMEIDFYNGTSQLNTRYPNLIAQGLSAELVAEKYQLSRSQLDEYAFRSQRLAALAWSENRFEKSIIPVTYKNTMGLNVVLNKDEHTRPHTTIEVLNQLKPVFKENGMITAGNSSGIVDGSATVLLASKEACKKNKFKPRARIIATAVVGADPTLMLLGPIEAIKKALKIIDLKLDDIDLFEINEAFASVPLAIAHELSIPLEKINVNGGAIALGHPLGATGTILFGTLLDEIERQKKRYGLVTLCTGYGMAVATIIDRKL